MKINEFCKNMQVTKKTVHFYIEEGLLTPTQDQKNGYYHFSEKEIKTMEIILLLRSLDFSIHEIKECFSYPTLTNYFLHRHTHDLKINIKKQLIQLDNIYHYIETIPPNAKPWDLLSYPTPSTHSISSDFMNTLFPNIDARMIAIIILAPFLAGKVNDYQQFLWDKISKSLQIQLGNAFPYYQRLIYHLTPKQIVEATSYAYYRFQHLLKQENMDLESDWLIEQCQYIFQNEALQKTWHLLYEPLLKPTIHLFFDDSIQWVHQYNDEFIQCMNKMNELIQMTSHKINESSFKNEWLKHITVCDPTFYTDLFLVYYFKHSIYAQCSFQIIQDHILK